MIIYRKERMHYCCALIVTSELLLAETISDLKSCDDGPVTLDVCVVQILEQAAALTYHLEQTATGMMVVLKNLQMLIEVIDASCKNRDLNLGRTRVAFSALELGNDLRLVHFNGHLFS